MLASARVYTVVSVKINNVTVTLASVIVADRNRKETADFGNMKVLNTIATRYEPYSIIDITVNSVDTYQYLVESDVPLLLKNGLYEHEITMIENMAYFSTVYPANRSFTTIVSKTVGEILDIYKKELGFYQDITISYDDTDTIYDTKMPYKEYSDKDFAVILYDLYKRIDAIPRATYVRESNTWVLTYEKYTDKSSAVTLGTEHQQSEVNDVDYASEILSRTRNATNENIGGIWYPSKTGHITPRIKGEMFKTSDLQFELDSGILGISKALAVDIPINIQYYDTDISDYVVINDTIDVDFTEAVIKDEEWEALKNNYYNGVIRNPLPEYIPGYNEPTYYRQNTVHYSIGKNTITDLYNNVKALLVFEVDILPLRNAIFQFVRRSALLLHPLPEYITSPNDYSFSFTLTETTEDIKCRFFYQPQRDVDVVSERNYIGSINKTTLLNSQKDSYIDLPRFLENNNAIVNRIGNEIKGVSQWFNYTETYWKLGDYVGDWVIIDIRYTFDKSGVNCLADFAKDFSNIAREYSIAREPSAFAYTGKRLTSNFVYRKYLEFYTGTNTKVESDYFTAISKLIAMNILDYDSDYNKPLYNASLTPSEPVPNIFLNTATAINAPVFGNGAGNVIAMHFGFADPLVAGNGMLKIEEASLGTYAWYKNPIKYVQDDFTLAYVRFSLAHDITLKTDTSTLKYYPQILRESGTYTQLKTYPVDKNIDDALGFTIELIPYSDDEDFIIGPAFTKYNNLIYEFDTAPTLELYSGITKYTIFDKKIRYNDVLQVSGITISGNTITTPTLEFWALAYNDEIVIAGNNYMNDIDFKFIDDRYIQAITVITKKLALREQDVVVLTYQAIENLTFAMSENDTMTLSYTALEYEANTRNINIRESDIVTLSYVAVEYEVKTATLNMVETDRVTVTYSKVQNTTTPTLQFTNYTYSAPNHQFTFLVTNNSSLLVEVFADRNATPTTSQGTLASTGGKNVVLTNTTGNSETLYVRVKSASENYSATVNATGSVS